MPDFGIGETAAVVAGDVTAGTGSAAAAAAAQTGATAAAGASWLPWLQGGSALLSLLGVAGSTRAGVQAGQGQATLAAQEAASARAAAAYNANQTDRANKLMIAKGVATAGASGLDVSSGSPLLNELTNVKQAAIQKQNILNMGENQGQALDYQSRLAQAGIAGTITGGIAQGGSVLSSWMGSRQYASMRGY